MKLTINITAQDIETALPCNCFQCPIARAMMRQIPGCESVEARPAVLYFRDGLCGRRGLRATPPQEVKDFMHAFDNEQHVQPFSFTATFKTGKVDRDGKEQLHAI